MEKQMNINLTVVEIEGLIKVLGSLPTSSNVWPIVVKISQQYLAQKPKDETITVGEASPN